MSSACPYTEFLSLRFACRELLVMLEREFTISGWLVLFSLKVTIIKWSHFIVFATVFPSESLSCARRNNLQHKDKNTQLTLITVSLENNVFMLHMSVLRGYTQSLGFMYAACSPCSCPTNYFVHNLRGVCNPCGRLQFREDVDQLPLDRLGKAGSLFSHH